MTLASEDYLSHLQDESARFRTVLADCAPDAQVPGCPAWTAADLLWHLTRVQDFWAHVISHRPGPPEAYDEPTRPSSYADLLTAFHERTQALTGALKAADPADPAWSWAADQTVGFTYRRQALEALVHRVDAEQTAGVPSELDPRLAADGVHEVLDVFFGGPPPEWGTFSPLEHYVRIDVTDTGDTIWAQLGRFSGTDADGIDHQEDDFHVVADPGVEPDAVISGTASDLLLRLWRRGDGADTHVAGNLEIVDHFRRAIHYPID